MIANKRSNACWAHFRAFPIEGVGTTLPFLKFAIGHPAFVGGEVSTGLVNRMITEMPSGRV